MTKITYEIVKHDGGWAYRVDETYSETSLSQRAFGDRGRVAHRTLAGAQRREAIPNLPIVTGARERSGGVCAPNIRRSHVRPAAAGSSTSIRDG